MDRSQVLLPHATIDALTQQVSMDAIAVALIGIGVNPHVGVHRRLAPTLRVLAHTLRLPLPPCPAK